MLLSSRSGWILAFNLPFSSLNFFTSSKNIINQWMVRNFGSSFELYTSPRLAELGPFWFGFHHNSKRSKSWSIVFMDLVLDVLDLFFWILDTHELRTVLPEVFCQKSPILVQFIAKFARFLAQNRGKFANLGHFFLIFTPYPKIFKFYCIFMH